MFNVVARDHIDGEFQRLAGIEQRGAPRSDRDRLQLYGLADGVAVEVHIERVVAASQKHVAIGREVRCRRHAFHR